MEPEGAQPRVNELIIRPEVEIEVPAIIYHAEAFIHQEQRQ